MNSPLVKQVLGRVIAIECALMLIPVFVSLIYGESPMPFVLTILIGSVISYLLMRARPRSRSLYALEGFVIVALSWMIMSAIGCLPFIFSGEIPSFVDAFFETVSGFTTTGATVVTDIEAMNKGTMFWRCFTNWIGGMGVLVFVMFVLPMSEEHSMHILRAEMPGPVIGKFVPKVRDTAMILYVIYTVLTLAIVVLLMLGGMNLYDALLHAFSTAGTGGFSNYASSVAHFDSAYIDYVIGIGLLLFGTNFNLYYLLLARKFKDVFTNEEFRWYIGIVVVASVTIACFILPTYGSFANAFRYAFFQVASIITTAGHVTANYDLWPVITQVILFMLMICGASAGGTNGGIKISRILIVGKTLKNEIINQIRPREVHTVKLNGEVVSRSTQHTTMVFVILYILIITLSTLIVSLDNFDFTSTFTAVVACTGNIGPASGIAGPAGNFASFSDLSKFVLSMCMLLGRLEIIPVLIACTPFAWRKKF